MKIHSSLFVCRYRRAKYGIIQNGEDTNNVQLVTSFIENPSVEDTIVKGEEDECSYSHPPFCLFVVVVVVVVWSFCCPFWFFSPFFLFSVYCLVLVILLHPSLAASLMCEPVPVAAFADYVQRHHREENQLFSDEYSVSL